VCDGTDAAELFGKKVSAWERVSVVVALRPCAASGRAKPMIAASRSRASGMPFVGDAVGDGAGGEFEFEGGGPKVPAINKKRPLTRAGIEAHFSRREAVRLSWPSRVFTE
jgi:hypothetical protein